MTKRTKQVQKVKVFQVLFKQSASLGQPRVVINADSVMFDEREHAYKFCTGSPTITSITATIPYENVLAILTGAR